MLSGYANSAGYETKAINLFKQMHSVRHEARVDEFSLTRMCNLTAKLGNSWYAKQLHLFMVKTGNDVSGFAVSELVNMYSKSGLSHPNRWRNHRGAALSETDCSEVSTTTIIQFSFITRPIPCPK
ncbi:hypothetical protein Hdeb2414_s0029g00705951 [Helianthus debilis subsp. tardiflorus]